MSEVTRIFTQGMIVGASITIVISMFIDMIHFRLSIKKEERILSNMQAQVTELLAMIEKDNKTKFDNLTESTS